MIFFCDFKVRLLMKVFYIDVYFVTIWVLITK
jgi:hypothetical protein